MKRMCRKWICIFLSVIMLCVPLSISATAEERAVYVLSPETGLTETNVAIQEEDLFIPAEVAEYIAEFFVADMFETGQTVWQTEPSVLNVVPMYDETGEKITTGSTIMPGGSKPTKRIPLRWSGPPCAIPFLAAWPTPSSAR